jgi:hypothetical protein
MLDLTIIGQQDPLCDDTNLATPDVLRLCTSAVGLSVLAAATPIRPGKGKLKHIVQCLN